MILVFKQRETNNVFFIDNDSDMSDFYRSFNDVCNKFYLHFSFKLDYDKSPMVYEDFSDLAAIHHIVQPSMWFDLYVNALDFFIERGIDIESFSFLIPKRSTLDALTETYNIIDLFFKEIKEKYMLLPVHIRQKITEVAYAKE